MIAAFLGYHYHEDLSVEKLREKYAEPYSQFVEVDGMPVHYFRKGTGPTLVLLHGFGGHVWNWRTWMEELDDEFDLMAVDLPGFGLTGPRPDRTYNTQKNVEFLAAFLDKTGVESCYLAGNSMGGGIAWNFTLEHPERVDALVLIAAAGYPKTSKKTIPAFMLLQYKSLHGLLTKITPKFIIQKSLAGSYVDPSFATDEEAEIYMDLLRREGNRQVLIDRARSPRSKSRLAEMSTIQQPTLVLWGREDGVIPVGHADKFMADLPNAHRIIYDQTGHLPMDERGAQSARDVKKFLQSVENLAVSPSLSARNH